METEQFLFTTFSFWIPSTSIPGRMGLLVTSYLVLINIAAGNSDRYRLDAFTAVDAWLYGCKILVTLAIFEYAWILKMRELDTRQAEMGCLEGRNHGVMN